MLTRDDRPRHFRDQFHQRHHRRHPIRRFFRSARQSMRGVGIALLLSLLVAAALVYAFLPAAEVTYGFVKSVPGAVKGTEMENAQKAARKAPRPDPDH